MSKQPESLHDTTDQYLRSAAGLNYPQALVKQFPHVINKIVQLKDDKDELRAYFDSLTHDKRGNRRGFALAVLMDIQSLREFIIGDVNEFHLNDITKWVS